MGYETPPTGTSVDMGILGTVYLDSLYITYMSTNYGMPSLKGYYTKICAPDYPSQLPIAYDGSGNKITGYTWASDVVTMPATTYNSWASKQYCDGSATTLAVAGAAVAAVAVSMY